jgi:hypothetical protein
MTTNLLKKTQKTEKLGKAESLHAGIEVVEGKYSLKQDNDFVKSAMAAELVEIGLSRKSVCRILNIRNGEDI